MLLSMSGQNQYSCWAHQQVCLIVAMLSEYDGERERVGTDDKSVKCGFGIL